MVKFLHTADWQLGMTRHFLAGEAQSRFDGARIDAIRAIGVLAAQEECSFVVVCGDVFESNQVSRQIVARALEAMAATPTVKFYLLPGNHDPLDASSLYRSPTFTKRRPENVVVLQDTDPVEPEPGVELVPAPWFSKRPLTDLPDAACDSLEASQAVRILVGHGAVDLLSPDKSDPALISLSSLEKRLSSGQVHFVALGDRHSTTDVGRTGRVWYSGAPEPTDYVEVDPGNVLIVEVNDQHVEVLPQRVGTWQFHHRDWELTGDADLDALEEWLNDLEAKDRSIVKVALVGQVTLAHKARLDQLLERHADLLAALETWERRSELAVIPDGADLSDLGLSGFAQEAVDDLAELAESSDEQAVVARDALALLHRLVEAST